MPVSVPASLVLTVCLSYGSRLDVVSACRSLCADASAGALLPSSVSEALFSDALSSGNRGRAGGGRTPDPEIVVRTGGERRLSNFMLWEAAYSELFFLDKNWPDVTKDDFIAVWDEYRRGRNKRIGR